MACCHRRVPLNIASLFCPHNTSLIRNQGASDPVRENNIVYKPLSLQDQLDPEPLIIHCDAVTTKMTRHKHFRLSPTPKCGLNTKHVCVRIVYALCEIGKLIGDRCFLIGVVVTQSHQTPWNSDEEDIR